MIDISDIKSVRVDLCEDDRLVIRVRAIIEDAALLYAKTLYVPEEYSPCLCEATLEYDDYDDWLHLRKQGILELLEYRNPEWTIVEV